MTDHYLKNYDTLTLALAQVKPDPSTGKLEPHCFAIALGEVGGIWPASILSDPDRRIGRKKAKQMKKSN